jgi:hypothetical protein
MDAHSKNKPLATQLQDNLENHGKSLANQHSQVSKQQLEMISKWILNKIELLYMVLKHSI